MVLLYLVGTTAAPSTTTWVPEDTHGWWWSTIKFAGAANLATTPSNPKAAREWSKLSSFATGNGAMLGGAPGSGVTFNNHLIYPGNDYTVGTTYPTIRIFDGSSDRLMATIPPTSTGAIPKAIMSMIIVGGNTIYVSTLDSGTSAADYAGRVFAFDPNSQNLTPVATGFSSGEVPYALAWHMGRLWVGTNKGNGTAGKVYFFRPGIDTAWTTDHLMSTETTGGVVSFYSYLGKLYVGSDNAAGAFAKVLVRDSAGAYTTSLTATGGTARVNNGFLSMMLLGTNLYVGYWNPDTTAVSKVYKFDGTNWTTAYTGAATTLRPYIGMLVTDNYLLTIGGGSALSASLIGTSDGATWDNLTPFLTGATSTETALPIFGMVGS